MGLSMDITKLTSALIEIDKLKSVTRQSYVAGGSRRENSAEHSWHTAVAVWMLSEAGNHPVDQLKLLKMAIIHDLCEIDHGDTPVYAPDQSHKFNQESACMDRICRLYPELLDQFKHLWLEYEQQNTIESKLLKVADRLLPFVHNLESEGKSWKEQNISRSQVLKVNQPIKALIPRLFHWIEAQIDQAVVKGWLTNN
jgi:putative hydrolase of HD superfamily